MHCHTVSHAKAFNNRLQYFVIEFRIYLCRKILKIFFPRKQKQSWELPTLLSNWIQMITYDCESCLAMRIIKWLIYYYFCHSLKKNHKYLLTINLFTPLLQIKLFWRNNITFTRKFTIEEWISTSNEQRVKSYASVFLV